MENLEADIAELLEVDEVKETDILDDFEAWDSLTTLSIIAYVNENYKISISAQDLVEAKTVGGLKELVLSKAGK